MSKVFPWHRLDFTVASDLSQGPFMEQGAHKCTNMVLPSLHACINFDKGTTLFSTSRLALWNGKQCAKALARSVRFSKKFANKLLVHC